MVYEIIIIVEFIFNMIIRVHYTLIFASLNNTENYNHIHVRHN